jgi:tetratricopeptide (TPR) repeat protein
VLDGRAAELERDRPFGVIVEALDAHVASLRGPKLRALGPEVRAELGRVLPSSRDADEAEAGGVVQDERYRAYRAVGALLEHLAIARPLVLALDDLHWADPASIELVSHLLTRGLGPRAALLLAFRTGQVPARLSGALELAERDGRATLLELGPFTRVEVEDLIGSRVDATTADRLCKLSGGNPFYLEQLVRAWERDPGALVPAGVRATVEAEVEVLEPSARRVLEGGAVAGDPFEPDIAAAAADLGEPATLEAIDVLIAHRLVLPTSVPRRFRFRHPIVREAVYESSGGGWRIAAHARAAAALEARGATASERAHHVERAASPGDVAAVELLAAASEEARPRAPVTAARWLGSALRLLPGEAAGWRLALLVSRASCLASAGELEDARDASLEALELVGDEPSPLRVQLVVLAAGVEHLMGRNRNAYERLRTALEAIPDQSGAEAATLKLQLAVDRVYVVDLDAALGWASEAHELAQAIDDRALRAAAAGTLATCQVFGGVADRDGSEVGVATHLLDDLADTELAARIETTYYTGYAEGFYEDLDAALRHLERGLAVSRATGQGHYIAPLMIGTGYVLERHGRVREAFGRVDAAVEVTRLTGNDVWLLGPRCQLVAAGLPGRPPCRGARRGGGRAAARRPRVAHLRRGHRLLFRQHPRGGRRVRPRSRADIRALRRA